MKSLFKDAKKSEAKTREKKRRPRKTEAPPGDCLILSDSARMSDWQLKALAIKEKDANELLVEGFCSVVFVALCSMSSSALVEEQIPAADPVLVDVATVYPRIYACTLLCGRERWMDG